MTIAELIDLVTKGSLATLLLVILWGGKTRIWVWGYQYQEMKARADKFEALCFKLAGIADEAVKSIPAAPKESRESSS